MPQQILVISDLKDTTSGILETATYLAKSLQKDIFFLSVSKPTEIVQNDSQLTAIRNINYAHCKTVDKIKQLIKPFVNNYNIKIEFKHTIGNVKNEILENIQSLNPSIIILGKRKPKIININGDKLTNFIFKNYKGIVILADKSAKISTHGTYSLAIASNDISASGKAIVESLENYSPKIIKETNSTLKNRTPNFSPKEIEASLKEKKYHFVLMSRSAKTTKMEKVISNVDSTFILTS